MENENGKQKRTGLVIAAAVCVVVVIAVWLVMTQIIPGDHYQQGQAALTDKRYTEAYDAFQQAGAYKDAPRLAQEAMYLLGSERAARRDYAGAAAAFQLAPDVEDAAALAEEYLTMSRAAYGAEGYRVEHGAVIFDNADGAPMLQVPLGAEAASTEEQAAHIPALTAQNTLTPKSQGGLWGYADADGAFVIQPAYEKAGAMENGVALVRLPTRHELVNGQYREVEGLWQVIDDKGNTLLTARGWEPYVTDRFRQGWLPVKFTGGGLGYINASGKRLLNRTWESIDASYDRYAVAADYFPSTTYVLDMQEGRIVASIETSEDVTVDAAGFVFERHRKSSNYTLRNFSGTQLLSGIKREEAYTSSMGCPFYVLGDKYLVVGSSNGGYGLYAISGPVERRQIRCIIASNWDYLCGSTAARLMQNPDSTGGIFSIGQKRYVAQFGGSTMVYGFVNVNGTLVSDVQWWDIHEFNADGIAFVRDARGWGVINTSGAFVIEPQWDRVAPGGFEQGLCAVLEGDLWGYIDMQNNLVIPCKFNGAEPFTAEGRAIVTLGDEKCLIDRAGNVLIDGCHQINRVSGGYVVKRDGVWQVLNERFERIF